MSEAEVIDVHNHYFPPDYIAAVRAGPSGFDVTTDDEGNPVLHSPGDYNVAVRGHRDVDYRVGVLDDAGIAMQLLTLTAPGTSIETPARAVELARLVNNRLSDVVRRLPDRFSALATLPMNAPTDAVAELRRATTELGLPGAMIFSNASGVPLADRRFWPLYAAADELGAVLYIHPTYPLGVEAMHEFMLMPLVGFLTDTTLAAAHLVYAGVPERFPGIRWILGHLGGAIPYLAERLDRGYEAFRECRENLTRLPSEYLREFHYDTVNFDPRALRFAMDFAGADQLLAGSDYPHMIGSLDKMKNSIRAAGFTADEQAKVLGGNARRVLGLH